MQGQNKPKAAPKEVQVINGQTINSRLITDEAKVEFRVRIRKNYWWLISQIGGAIFVF